MYVCSFYVISKYYIFFCFHQRDLLLQFIDLSFEGQTWKLSYIKTIYRSWENPVLKHIQGCFQMLIISSFPGHSPTPVTRVDFHTSLHCMWGITSPQKNIMQILFNEEIMCRFFVHCIFHCYMFLIPFTFIIFVCRPTRCPSTCPRGSEERDCGSTSLFSPSSSTFLPNVR